MIPGVPGGHGAKEMAKQILPILPEIEILKTVSPFKLGLNVRLA